MRCTCLENAIQSCSPSSVCALSSFPTQKAFCCALLYPCSRLLNLFSLVILIWPPPTELAAASRSTLEPVEPARLSRLLEPRPPAIVISIYRRRAGYEPEGSTCFSHTTTSVAEQSRVVHVQGVQEGLRDQSDRDSGLDSEACNVVLHASKQVSCRLANYLGKSCDASLITP